ncbi:HET-domain-containing protein [Acephala macrosclerotiorum]|nr:HET-domain-containing protein [Acephala macrosclerotiorum]
MSAVSAVPGVAQSPSSQKSAALRRLEALLSHICSRRESDDESPALTSNQSKTGLAYPRLAKGQKTRLLFLEPGVHEDDLRCHLETVESLLKHRYQALSYVWGEEGGPHSIWCNQLKLPITANLDAALRRLRYPDRARRLWVDAICINQADDAERSHQVQNMQEIYACASRVIIWLGEESKADALAFDSLQRLHDRQRSPLQLGLYRNSPTQGRSGNSYRLTLASSRAQPSRPALADVEGNHMVALLSREWFRRTWVIQEAASAKHAIVVCGAKSMHWEHFASACMTLQDGSLPLTQFEGVEGIREGDARYALEIIFAIEIARRAQSGPLTMSLFHILVATCSSHCKDDRDKIFAVIGLSKDPTERQLLTPNYEISEDHVLKLFQQFAVFDSVYHRSLRILSCASGPQKGNKRHIPSWVPDWRRLKNCHPFVRYSDRTQFCASGRMGPEAYYSNSRDLLNVTGKIVDTIVQIGPESKFTKVIGLFELDENVVFDLEESLKWLEGCQELALQSYEGKKSDRQEQFWRTMACGLTGEGFPVPSQYSKYFESYMDCLATAPKRLRKYLLGLPESRRQFLFIEEVMPNSQQHALIEASLDHWASSRRFCITQKGRLAFVPSDAQEGDIITILFGGEVPYVLRPLIGHGWHNVVGECYVDGIMFGEGLSDEARSKIFQLW